MILNAHSYYSLRYGTYSVEELVADAARHGHAALALTDINNSTGVVDFVKACGQQGIKPIAGMECRRNESVLYTLLARNNAGFRQINDFYTHYSLQKLDLPDTPFAFDDVYVVWPLERAPQRKLEENEFVGVKPAQVRKLVTSSFAGRQSKLIVWTPVTFRDHNDYLLHRNLRAIHKNTLISKLTAPDVAAADEMMRTPDDLRKQFADYPHLIINTEKILGDCSIDFDFKTVKNKQVFTDSRYSDKMLLEKLAIDGMKYRYGAADKTAAERICHELAIIDKLGFSSYFLMAWDIVRYSMSRGFYHVGRGSGANSVVAYCLKITDVDPIELDLYFERFINPKRTSPPDFDIDYSWKERDEVIDYIFKRYGREHTALMGTISTFRDKSPIREIGKAFGLPKAEIDALVDFPERHGQQHDSVTAQVLQVAARMTDFPNLRSIHAGGVLISEEPITSYTALDMPPKGFPTTQWDMYVAEALGFEKMDILSQRGIGHIKECADIIRRNRGLEVDVHSVPKFKKDAQVKAQLKRAETIGCFYIESPAMRSLLTKLRCDNYLTLVAASSIVRPGVARSGMMREYIHRFHHPNDFEYFHPVMEEQLRETFGVMVYQEDVLKVCHHYAGLDLAESDVLRRAMSGKMRGKAEFQRIVERFFEKSLQLGRPEATTKEVWRQVESFAGYAFSKAHSASYAVESFQSLYLKAHFPLEFMTAVINNFGGYYNTWVYFNEARRCGAAIALPCVNRSEYKTTIYGEEIFVGFIHIQNLEQKLALRIVEERRIHGVYADLEDFVTRVHPGIEQMILLIRTGALRFTGNTKSRLLWEAHLFFGKRKNEVIQNTLFKVSGKQFTLPQLDHSSVEDAYDEIELIGFPVTITYFDLLKTNFRGEIKAREMLIHVGKTVRMLGQLVTRKYVKTVRGEIMHFGTFIDDEGEFFDTTHFPNSLRQYNFQGYGVYLILGKVEEEFGFPSLVVQKMARLPVVEDPRSG
ncbi:MAG: DNA polymerase III subunit alpha [Bacteroidales bacterium]|nr:DNA polymerase III subunit alpha [Bacteroidales bacterium]MDD2633524.1 DNA polymerase III subunit alpha [Bacteroidales bacterium]MDD4178175.1 DNA polymerase III subunit alpha [Bacteroidales bacterium]MDD4742438.1 DNA polymerase III subunit alpha [Bacteroidales bacterium]MDY0335541.1 DNA polymerase III subunit alpha [Bacteroidales bacterium]